MHHVAKRLLQSPMSAYRELSACTFDHESFTLLNFDSIIRYCDVSIKCNLSNSYGNISR